MYRGKVKGRDLSYDSSIIRTCNENPILNTITHDVEFEDDDVGDRMANIICENMLTRIDVTVNITMSLQTMLNHKKMR